MKKVDSTVRKETLYITAWVVVFSVIMQAVFLIIGKWDYTVLLGNLLGGGIAVLNFFLMGITVQKAVTKEEKDAKNTMKISQGLRSLLLLIIAAIGIALPWFNIWTTIIPLFFPRVAIAIRPVLDMKKSKGGE